MPILLKIEHNFYWAWISVKLVILNDATTFFNGFRVRRGTEIVEFGDILAFKVVVGAMALL